MSTTNYQWEIERAYLTPPDTWAQLVNLLNALGLSKEATTLDPDNQDDLRQALAACHGALKVMRHLHREGHSPAEISAIPNVPLESAQAACDWCGKHPLLEGL